jgi:Putative adhesin/Domain of unknown function (DUF5668)
MSSPVSYPVQPPVPPPAQPPLPRRHRRSFAGPFVLIVLGVVFLLGNMRLLSWSQLGLWFAHYWPVLLILWGVIKLVEHQQAQRDGLAPRGIGAGGVFLVIVIVFFGLIATHVARFHWDDIRNNLGIDDSDIGGIFGEKYNFDDHLEQAIPPTAASLRVDNDQGAVRVSVANDNKITVIVRKRVAADNQGDADKYNRQTKPEITVAGNMIVLDAKTHAAGDHPVQSDLDISIPRKMAVHITSRKGEVSVTGRDGDVEVNNQHGDVSVEDVNGSVKLNLEKSSAKVEQITGDVHIAGHLNEVSVMDVKGSTQLDGEFQESVKLARVSKNVVFKSSRTNLEFSRIDGELDLDSDDLHADKITGPVRLTTRSKQIRLVDVSGDVRVQDDNGGIELTLRSPGNVQIDNRNGDVQLSLPDKAGFRVDARTRDGEIQSDFPELKIQNGDHEASATGSVGNGASHIVINNQHDSIEIRKASATAASAPPAPPALPAKPAKSLPAPKAKVEPTDN